MFILVKSIFDTAALATPDTVLPLRRKKKFKFFHVMTTPGFVISLRFDPFSLSAPFFCPSPSEVTHMSTVMIQFLFQRCGLVTRRFASRKGLFSFSCAFLPCPFFEKISLRLAGCRMQGCKGRRRPASHELSRPSPFHLLHSLRKRRKKGLTFSLSRLPNAVHSAGPRNLPNSVRLSTSSTTSTYYVVVCESTEFS